MIGSLLVLAHVGRSEAQLEGEPVLIRRLVADLVERRRAEDLEHAYALDVRSSDVIAACEPSWAERVLANLLGNAAKYSPAGDRSRPSSKRSMRRYGSRSSMVAGHRR